VHAYQSSRENNYHKIKIFKKYDHLLTTPRLLVSQLSAFRKRSELGLAWHVSSISQQECEIGSSECRGTQFGSGKSPETSVLPVTSNHMN
jgi:hypothetical protein